MSALLARYSKSKQKPDINRCILSSQDRLDFYAEIQAIFERGRLAYLNKNMMWKIHFFKFVIWLRKQERFVKHTGRFSLNIILNTGMNLKEKNYLTNGSHRHQ